MGAHGSRLATTRLPEDEQAAKQKQHLRKDNNSRKLGENVYSLNSAERKQLWKDIGEADGAWKFSFAFYRKLYINVNNKDKNIRKFCEYFARQRFDVAVDRIVRFFACELNGATELHNLDFVDRFHNELPGADHIMSPLNAQIWFSMMISGINDDLKQEWDDQVTEKFVQFIKDIMVFLMMSTWVNVKDELKYEPMAKLIFEPSDSKQNWHIIYEENSKFIGYKPSYLEWYQKEK